MLCRIRFIALLIVYSLYLLFLFATLYEKVGDFPTECCVQLMHFTEVLYSVKYSCFTSIYMYSLKKLSPIFSDIVALALFITIINLWLLKPVKHKLILIRVRKFSEQI